MIWQASTVPQHHALALAVPDGLTSVLLWCRCGPLFLLCALAVRCCKWLNWWKCSTSPLYGIEPSLSARIHALLKLSLPSSLRWYGDVSGDMRVVTPTDVGPCPTWLCCSLSLSCFFKHADSSRRMCRTCANPRSEAKPSDAFQPHVEWLAVLLHFADLAGFGTRWLITTFLALYATACLAVTQ